MQTKICTKCGVQFPATLQFFRQNITHKYGLYSQCKKCEKIYIKEYIKSNRNKVNLWEKNSELRKKGLLPPRLKSIEYQIGQQKLRRKTYNNSPKGKIHNNLKVRITTKLFRFVNGIKLKPNTKIDKLLGYSSKELANHIESLFRDNMNWENYGKLWNIDHIMPVSSFKEYPFTDSSIKECWSIKNLQPLLLLENAQKGSKILK